MFTVTSSVSSIPQGTKSQVFLIIDYWDDWFSYRTMFAVAAFDQHGNRHALGSVKIGQAGLLPMGATENLPPNTRIPQYGFCFKYGNLENNRSAVFPFNVPIKSDMGIFGGTFTNKCT